MEGVRSFEVEVKAYPDADQPNWVYLLFGKGHRKSVVCKDVVGLEPGDTATVVILKHERKADPPKVECPRFKPKDCTKMVVMVLEDWDRGEAKLVRAANRAYVASCCIGAYHLPDPGVQEVKFSPLRKASVKEQAMDWLRKHEAVCLDGLPIPDPDPPKEERKECRKLKPIAVGSMDLCENCLGPVSDGETNCAHCLSRFTHTIPWAEFTKRDC